VGRLVSALLLAGLLALDAGAHDPAEHEWQGVVLPIASVNVDEGVGGGAVAALYHYYGGVEPMRDDLSLRIFATSKLVQRHEIRWEGRRVFDLPLRLWLRLSMFSTVTQLFCGVGAAADCDEAHAKSAADDAGLSPATKPYDEFVRRYFLTRYIRPGADTLWRWQLFDRGDGGVGDFLGRIEAMAGWRFNWYRPGDFFHKGPYPGSFYAEQFPQGEPGISSVWQLGVTVDARDFEPSPTRGYFLEASVRASHPYWGSHWSYAGMNTSLSTYFLLGAEPETVLANRAIVDLLNGDVPTAEIAETGGTHDHAAFGGQWIGRGIRDHHYIGKVKVIDQIEARTHLFDVTVWAFKADVAGSIFVDAGYIGTDLQSVTSEPFRILYGAGAGLRFLFQDAINMRVDVAASPDETHQPSFYTPVGYPF
jgi:hypothetical protein